MARYAAVAEIERMLDAATQRAEAADASTEKACAQRRVAELAHDQKTDEVRELNRQLDAAIQRAVAAEQALARVCTLHARDDYHEDIGNVVWWTLPICEPPYVGTELDTDFPDYATHWSRLPATLTLDGQTINLTDNGDDHG